VEGGPLFPIDLQCRRIDAVRKAGRGEGVPVVINARTDVWLSGTGGSVEELLEETIKRARAYLDAGAHCIYPITLSNLDVLKELASETKAPINVYATASLPPMKKLEAAGISRLSLGPGLIKASLTAMRSVALELKEYGSYDSFTKSVVTNDEIEKYVSPDDMP
jgi:2-methylisocitrate lyase-like PEP mutase family enzyme